MRTRVAAAVLVALLWLALPSFAQASVWKEGTASLPFTLPLSSSGGLLTVKNASGDPALTLPYEASTVFSAPSDTEIRSVRVSTDGSYLAACASRIIKVLPSGQSVSYQQGFGDIPHLDRAWDACPLSDGGMVIVDRGPGKAALDATPTAWIMCVDSAGKQRWRYDTWQGPLRGQLLDPFSAEPADTKTGTTLIADSLGDRVIEINNSTGVVGWSYGHYGVPGSGVGYLQLPHSAQLLDNTDILICDSENQRVIEVTHDDLAPRIVWSYTLQGKVGDSGPNSARQLKNGNTVISDSAHNRVIVVNPKRAVVEAYGVAGRTPANGALINPRAAVPQADGSTLIADYGNHRLVRYGYHPRREYVATFGPIDPAFGKMKWFSRITVSAARPDGALVAAEYSTDGREWFDVPASGALPSTTKGSAIRYRLHLSTGSAGAAPVVNDVSITWSDTAPGSGTKKSGSTSSGSKGKTSSTGAGTGTTNTLHATTTAGTGSATGSGSGSQSTTTLAPGGSSSAIGGGMPGDSAIGSGDSVRQASAKSGWVMSEVKDDVGGMSGTSGTGGFGPSSGMGRSSIPGVGLLFAAYTIGLAWSPASKFVVRLVVAAMAH